VLLECAIQKGNLLKQRLLASGDVQRFEYDASGRPTEMQNEAGTCTFAYAPDGKRTLDAREGLGVEHRYEWGKLVETKVLGRFAVRYLRPKANTVLVVDPGDQVHRMVHHGVGVVERADASGAT